MRPCALPGQQEEKNIVINVLKRLLRIDPTVWTINLVLLATAGFLQRFGLGLLDGARTNFFVDTLGLSGNQVLWLEGIREIPGLLLMFIAALTMRFPLSYRTGVAVIIMGVGYGLYAIVDSFTGLLAVAVLASLGMHLWMPLNSSLAMSLSPKEKAGSVRGTLNGIGSLAGIVGMAALALVTRFAGDLPLSAYYIIGAVFIILSGFLILRIPPDVGATEVEPPHLLLSKRYWLYYVLTFLQGSRKQVLNTFGMLVLVDRFGLPVWQISLVLLVSSVINLIGAPYLGRMIDRLGERTMVTGSYIILMLSCLGLALIPDVRVLIFLLLAIKLFVTVGIGLETYVYRLAPPEELTPTLSAGISINHVTSVSMPLIAGALLPHIGYSGIFLGTAGIILISIPFALAMRATPIPQPKGVVPAEG